MPPSDPEPAAPSAAIDEYFSATYGELRRLAHARLRASGRHAPLDTTALVHESYLRLSQQRGARFPDRLRFLVYAGRVMRSVIVDLVRQRQAERHGGDAVYVTLTTRLGAELAAGEGEAEILRVHEALEELEKVDERMARVVEMRYFAGMTEPEIAEALGVTDRTVRRDWQQARLFLAEALR